MKALIRDVYVTDEDTGLSGWFGPRDEKKTPDWVFEILGDDHKAVLESDDYHGVDERVEQMFYEEMTVTQLKQELLKRDLTVGGNKAQLIERLEENDQEEDDEDDDDDDEDPDLTEEEVAEVIEKAKAAGIDVTDKTPGELMELLTQQEE